MNKSCENRLVPAIAGLLIAVTAAPAGAIDYSALLPAGLLKAGIRPAATKHRRISAGTLSQLVPEAAKAKRNARAEAAKPHYEAAESAFRRGDWAQAAGECRNAMDVGKGTLYESMATHLLGRAFLEQSRYAEAKAELSKLVNRKGRGYYTQSLVGDVALAYLKTGDLAPITKLIQEDLTSINGDWPEFEANLPGMSDPAHIAASVYLVRGQFKLYNYIWPDAPMDFQGAVDELLLADSYAPGNPRISFLLGEALMKVGRNIEAERYLKLAIEAGKGYLVHVAELDLNSAAWRAKCDREKAKNEDR